MRNKIERHQHIIAHLSAEGVETVNELARKFNVTEATIRRDFIELSAAGKIERLHGAAYFPESDKRVESPFDKRSVECEDAKVAIAQSTVKLLTGYESIILDSGTTTLEVARAMPDRAVRVVSNSFPGLLELSHRSQIEYHCTGGRLFHENQCFIGPQAIRYIQNINVDVAIISASAFSFQRGFSNKNEFESEIKRAMIASAKEVIIVMDCSKFNQDTYSRICGLEDIDVLVTEKRLSDTDEAYFEAANIKRITDG